MEYDNLNDIAAALISLKYDVIVINLVTVFIAMIAIYLHARLKKSAELMEINNNFVAVLEQQKSLAVETGKINQSLNRESINYQIKLNAYHEKSIGAVNDVYIAVIELRDAAKQLGFNEGGNEEQRKFMRSVDSFKSIFDTRRIWIPADLSSHIEKVASEIDSRTQRFMLANKRAERATSSTLPQDRLEKIYDEQDQFYDYIHQEISVIFNELVSKVSKSISS